MGPKPPCRREHFPSTWYRLGGFLFLLGTLAGQGCRTPNSQQNSEEYGVVTEDAPDPVFKGNDIWAYQTSFLRRLPERYEPLRDGEYPDLKSRLVVALGPPGEYGEDSIKVPIDHGQPFFLPG